ncbi:MAG TPA: hypothetical protein VEQ58_09020, partial [Polyangiaceae bacterium]|nr:hypothetical protein [Polyangiaceae bacterium]
MNAKRLVRLPAITPTRSSTFAAAGWALTLGLALGSARPALAQPAPPAPDAPAPAATPAPAVAPLPVAAPTPSAPPAPTQPPPSAPTPPAATTPPAPPAPTPPTHVTLSPGEAIVHVAVTHRDAWLETRSLVDAGAFE